MLRQALDMEDTAEDMEAMVDMEDTAEAMVATDMEVVITARDLLMLTLPLRLLL